MSAEEEILSLEEGELADSGSDNETMVEEANNPVATSVAGGAIQKSNPVQFDTKSSTMAAYQRRTVPSFGSDDEDESESDDQETESSPIKKPFRGVRGVASGKSLAEQHGNRFMQAAMEFQEKHNANKNVWGNVVAEQTLTQTVGAFNMEQQPEGDQDRGVESYNFELAKRESRTIGVYDDDIFDMKSPSSEEEEEEEETEQEANIFDKEVFGTGDDKEKSVKSHLGKRKRQAGKDRQSNSTDDMDIRDNRDRRGDQDRPVTERIGQKSCSAAKPTGGDIRVTQTDSPESVAEELVRLLDEPPGKIELFSTIATVLGSRKALDLFYMTESVEATGGMLVMKGTRRRTPGGVYIQLLKTDSSVTKDDLKEIFKEDDKSKKEWRKERKKKKVPTATLR